MRSALPSIRPNRGSTRKRFSNAMLVRINNAQVWDVPDRKFRPDLPRTTSRLYGKLLYIKVMDEWFRLVPGHGWSSSDEPVDHTTSQMINGLKDYRTDER